MNKLTAQQYIDQTFFQTIGSVKKLVADLKEQLTWTESDKFIPLYSKEDKKEILALAEKKLAGLLEENHKFLVSIGK